MIQKKQLPYDGLSSLVKTTVRRESQSLLKKKVWINLKLLNLVSVTDIFKKKWWGEKEIQILKNASTLFPNLFLEAGKIIFQKNLKNSIQDFAK